MTEQEWIECTDPLTMLGFLKGKASERKLRLFAVACCRRIWQLLDAEESRQAVEVAALYVDGQASDKELHAAWHDAYVVINLEDDEAFQSAWDYGNPTVGFHLGLIPGCVELCAAHAAACAVADGPPALLD